MSGISTASVIKPTTLTDAMLVSSSIDEPDASVGEVLWNAGTNYAVGAIAIRTTTHRRYKRLVAGTTAATPESDSTNWLDIGPTNRWAMFDRRVGTSSVSSSGVITVVINSLGADGIGMMELVGRRVELTLRDAPGGTVVFSRVIDLDVSDIESVYDWFYAEFEQRTDFAVTAIPPQFYSGQLTIKLEGTSTVSCGVAHIGDVLELGDTLAGASVGIIDYSKKETDPFGVTDVVEHDFSKEASFQILTKKKDFNKNYRRLAALRATPCIFIGSEAPGYEPLIVYGFYRDLKIVVEYVTHHLCSMEIEGLT